LATHSGCDLGIGARTERIEAPSMVIAWSGSLLEEVIYLLCVATSLLCAYLLLRAYRHGRAGLLIWSALCFALLAVNNLAVAVDVLLLPDIDLTFVRVTTSLLAVGVLLYGFIWEV
jgi:hypothetical protein